MLQNSDLGSGMLMITQVAYRVATTAVYPSSSLANKRSVSLKNNMTSRVELHGDLVVRLVMPSASWKLPFSSADSNK